MTRASTDPVLPGVERPAAATAAADWSGLTPPYSAIVADPPWRYRTRQGITARTSHHTTVAEEHYSTMTNDEIAALPVADLAADNAHLYLWTTNPKLYGQRKRGELGPVEIMEAWGFRYVTLLTWIKKGALGMGFYFRGETEHVLFGVRGDLGIPVEKRLVNWFEAPKTGHSRKPNKFFEIVHHVSPGPYLELFSREPRLGWDSWGKGVELSREAS